MKWTEFQFGPPLLEALNVGSIDYGPTGDAPPIFAQAARANLLYVASNETAGNGSAILVPANSSIRTLADLKGKRLGFARASSAHNLTIAAIEKAGLQPSDVTPIYLTPADARAAFERGPSTPGPSGTRSSPLPRRSRARASCRCPPASSARTPISSPTGPSPSATAKSSPPSTTNWPRSRPGPRPIGLRWRSSSPTRPASIWKAGRGR